MLYRILTAFFILLTFSAVLLAQEAPKPEDTKKEKEQPAENQKEEKSQAEQVARIESIEGDCETRASEKADWTAASAGATLPKGGSICTGFASKALLRFPGDTALEVGSLTEIGIDEFFASKEKLEAKLKLKIGSLKVTVEKGAIQTDFVVTTPNTTTAVKGTGFTLQTSYYGDTIEVQKDSVRVTDRAGTSLAVREGDETNSNLDTDSECRKTDSAGNPLSPGALTEEQDFARANLSSGPTAPSLPLSSNNPDSDRQKERPYIPESPQID
jgi:hypothetical protein